MEQKTQHGYLVLADISGYTSYLAGVELDHAHEVLTDLLETMVNSLKSLLTISKLEGDAVFAYVPESRVARGETLLELVEATYLAFRDRVEAIRRRTTCTCNACRAIPTLDLKFITHHGDYMVQTISGIHELVGSDVNLAHRLLKNHVAEKTGWKAYALFTAASLEHLVVPCDPRDLHPEAESYEHLGQVETYSIDLHKRYQELTSARHVVVADAEADLIMDHDFSAPPAVVWDWLNDPPRRNQWMEGTRWSAAGRPRGRTGVGAVNHCAHGKNEVTVETVLDWKPFDYATMKQDATKDLAFIVTYRLTPSPDGRRTRLHTALKGQSAKMPAWMLRLVTKVLLAMVHYPQPFGVLERVVNEAMARDPMPASADVLASAAVGA